MSTDSAWKVSKYGVFSGPYFPTFGLNRGRCFVSFRIQSECRKILTRKNSAFERFSHSETSNCFFFSVYFHTVHNSKTCPCWTVPDLAKCFAWTCKKDFVFKISDRIIFTIQEHYARVFAKYTYHHFPYFPQIQITLHNPGKQLLRWCRGSPPKVFWKYASNLQDNTHAEAWFHK